MSSIRSHAIEFVASTLRDVKEEQLENAGSASAIRATTGVLVVAGIMLVFREEQYRPSFVTLVDTLFPASASASSLLGRARTWIEDPRNWELARLMYWSLWQLVVYVLIPVVFIKVVLRENVRDYGLKLRGATKCWWAYVAMYLMILPFVLMMAHRESFQHTYPFFKPTDVDGTLNDAFWHRFWVWQFFYAIQFVSLEFFFRGFMLHGTRRTLGIGSIFVMMIPYCMIHFGKPLPETLGALVAGLVLGFMSLKTKSVWMGFASHMSVAITMDWSALAVWRDTVP